MSDVGPEGRSFEPITRADLEKLAALAAADRDQFFREHPDWAALYADRVLCTALGQGAALHYVRGDVGINDFDVYTFYAAHPERRWYAKRIKHVDFGDPRFGRTVEMSKPIGRRVDLMGRDLPVDLGSDPAEALRAYLTAGRTDTARHLAAKAVVLLSPPDLVGRVVWPPDADAEV
jgi:hypothetical protein